MEVEEFRHAVKPLGFGPNRHGEVDVGALAFEPDLLVQRLGNGIVQHVPKVPQHPARVRRRARG